MASPIQILNNLQNGVNTGCGATTQMASPVAPTPVIVQQNPIGCYSGCSLPPTPASVPLQPNLGAKCGDLQICIRNTSTAELVLVVGGPGGVQGFATDSNPAATFSAFGEITFGLTPVNASPSAISCNQGIVSGAGVNASYVQFMNQEFSDVPVILSGFTAAKFRVINDDLTDNIETQRSNAITAWEIDPFDGSVLDVCTRTMDVNFCSPCVGDSSANAPVTFQEDCVTYVGPNNGFSYVIEPNTQVTLQACYVGIADIYDYRDCSLPTWSPAGTASY